MRKTTIFDLVNNTPNSRTDLTIKAMERYVASLQNEDVVYWWFELLETSKAKNSKNEEFTDIELIREAFASKFEKFKHLTNEAITEALKQKRKEKNSIEYRRAQMLKALRENNSQESNVVELAQASGM